MSTTTSAGTTGLTRNRDPTPRLPKNIVYSSESTRSPSPRHHSIYPEMFNWNKPKQTSKFINRINAVVWQPYEGLVKIPPKCNKVAESKKAEADLKPVENKKAEANLKPLPSGNFSHWYENDLIEKKEQLQFPSAIKTAFNFFEPYPTPLPNERKHILLTFWKDSQIDTDEYSDRPSARMENPIRFTNACGSNIHLARDTFMTVNDITDAGLAKCIQDNIVRPGYDATGDLSKGHVTLPDATGYTPDENTELQSQTPVSIENNYTSEESLPTTPRSTRYSTSTLDSTLVWHSTQVNDSMPGRDINGHRPERSAYLNSSDGYAIGSNSGSWVSSKRYTPESSDNCNQSFCGYGPYTQQCSSYLNSSDGYPTCSSRSWDSSKEHTPKSSAYSNYAEENPLQSSSHFISRDEYAPTNSVCQEQSYEYATQNHADCEASEEYPLESSSQSIYRDEYAPQSGEDVEPVDGYGPQSGADVKAADGYSPQSGEDVDSADRYGRQSSASKVCDGNVIQRPIISRCNPYAQLSPIVNKQAAGYGQQSDADVVPVDQYSTQRGADVDPADRYSPQSSASKVCDGNVIQRPISRCNQYAQLSPIVNKQAAGYGQQSDADVDPAHGYSPHSGTDVEHADGYGQHSGADVDPANGYSPQSSADVDPAHGYGRQSSASKVCNVNVIQRPISRCNPYAQLSPIDNKQAAGVEDDNVKTSRSQRYGRCGYTAKDRNVKTPLTPISVKHGIDAVDCKSVGFRSQTPTAWNAKTPLPPISGTRRIDTVDCRGKTIRSPSPAHSLCEYTSKDRNVNTPLPPISVKHGIDAVDCKSEVFRSQTPIARNPKTPLPPISDIHGNGGVICKSEGFRSQTPTAWYAKTPLPPISGIHGNGGVDCKREGFRSQTPTAWNVKTPLPPISGIHGNSDVDCKSEGFRTQTPTSRNVKTPLPPISDIHGVGAVNCKSEGFRSQIPIARNVKTPLPPISGIHGIGAVNCKREGFRSQIPIARNVKTPLPPISDIHGNGALDCKSAGFRSKIPIARNVKTSLPPISSKNGKDADDYSNTVNTSPTSRYTARDWNPKTPLPPISGKRDDIAGGDATSRRLPPISDCSKHGAAGDIVSGALRPGTRQHQHSAGNRSSRGYLPPIHASIPTGYDNDDKVSTPRGPKAFESDTKMPFPPMLQRFLDGIDDSTMPESLSPPKCGRANIPLSPIPRLDLTGIGGSTTPDTSKRDLTKMPLSPIPRLDLTGIGGSTTPDTSDRLKMLLPPIPSLNWNNTTAEIKALCEYIDAFGKFTIIPSSPLLKQGGHTEPNADIRQTNVAKYWHKKTAAIYRDRLWQEPGIEAMDPPIAQDSVLDPVRDRQRRKRLDYLERVFEDVMKHDEELLQDDS